MNCKTGFGIAVFFLGLFALRDGFAEAHRPADYRITSLKGYAVVDLDYKKKHYRFDLAVLACSPVSFALETIDDFGGRIFAMSAGESRSKKMPFLPMSKDEFMRHMLYRTAEVRGLYPCDNGIGNKKACFEKAGKKKGRYKILFSDFKKKGKIRYPYSIEMISKKTVLKISWQSVQLWLEGSK